ncbi:MAG: UDP-N-acetylenolpyruvoylglucosamine reductase [Planctomycetota bacterium]|nr:UDP-N-acetylenolpyruvoylglucosamine reductase [Planctomycetota bacterium]
MHRLDAFREFVTESESLAPLTWFRLGGPAEYLARPRNLDELTGLLACCRSTGLSTRILGGGSNLLVRDEGVTGVVIQLESPAFSDVAVEGRRVHAGAAVPLTPLISQTARSGLAGLEILTGIPGTVGGALRCNAGGRGGAIGQFVHSVTVLDSRGEVQVRDRDDLIFGYRSSNLDDPVLLSAEFDLQPEDPKSVVKQMMRIWIVKKENQPYGHQSSGTIFKDPTPEVSARVLIEQSGLKGAREGGAEVSDRHANYIIAQAGATAADVLRLIDLIRNQVRLQFGYELELQIQIW